MTPNASPARDLGLPAEAPDPPSPEFVAPGRGEAARERTRRWPSLAPWLSAAIGVLVLPLAVAVGINLTAGSGGVASAQVVSAEDLEQEYGIRVDLVAVIAEGGLVDVRFTVVDSTKASHVLHDDTMLPALYIESSGTVLRTKVAKAHKMTVIDGASYFVLYPNSAGAIQRGTPVSVVIDRVRLEPMTAQS